MTEYFIQLYDYHYWANQRVLNAVSRLSEEQLRQSQGHSWGCVYETLLHMLNAEWIWLERWKGNSPAGFMSEEELPTLKALVLRWKDLEAEMRAFVADQTEGSLLREVAYTNTRGEPYRLALWQMLAHVPNHGTHHRGEIASMLALTHIEHPEEDWLYYFLATSGQRK
jgi:uncharacterized damage-inducible protein DinB